MAAPQRKDDPTLPPPWQALFGASRRRPPCRVQCFAQPALTPTERALNSPRRAARSHLWADLLLEPEHQRDAVRAAGRRSAAPSPRAGETAAAPVLVVAAVHLHPTPALTSPLLPTGQRRRLRRRLRWRWRLRTGAWTPQQR